MRRLNKFAAATAASLALLAGLAGPAQAQVTAFQGARVIIGDQRAPIENATIVVNGNRIVQVGPSASVTVPAGATRVNLAGKTVIPTFIDTHVHMRMTRDEAIQDLRRRAYFGVSAAATMSENGNILPIRNENIPGAARFYSAGRGITGREPGRSTIPYWATTPEEGRKFVQENAARKVDVVKIWVDDRDDTVTKLTPAIYGAIIDEAHKNNLRVTAHIWDLADGKGLLRANVDALAHNVRDVDADEEFMALVRQRPNLWGPTNLPERGLKQDVSWLRGIVPAAEFAEIEKAHGDDPKAATQFGIESRNMMRLYRAGIKIALGTDGNKPWGVPIELEDMVSAGLTPLQAIEIATKNGAEFLRIADAGTLDAGKSADFIVLDANPLDDIKNTRRISAVYLKGAAVDRSRYP